MTYHMPLNPITSETVLTGVPKFKPHSKKQSAAIRSALNPKISITAVITGIQWGKGVTQHTEILTINGYKKAKNIGLLDIVFDRNGEPTRVTGIYPQGIKPCFKIQFRCGRSIITDDSHLNIVIDPKNR